VYGPNQYPEKLIPKFIKLLQEGKKLTIHGRGNTRRNFIWVRDVASATALLLRRGDINGIYNIGTSQERTVLEIAEMLINMMTPDRNLENHISYVEDRPFNDFRYSIDSSQLRALGWHEELTDFEENIRSLILLHRR